MPRTTARRRGRERGQIEGLPSGSLRVTVYAGTDPLTKRRHYLREVIPAGPSAAADAQKALRRLAVQVDEKRNPQTSATVEQLLDRHFELLEVEPTTLATYRNLTARHILPLIGKQRSALCGRPSSTRSTPSCVGAGRTATAGRTSSTGRGRRTNATAGAAPTSAARSPARPSGRST